VLAQRPFQAFEPAKYLQAVGVRNAELMITGKREFDPPPGNIVPR
jgi:hypothetical protein